MEAPEELIDGDSTADGTAVTEDAADGRQLADASLTTVYNASTGNYGVYTTEDILTATDCLLYTSYRSYTRGCADDVPSEPNQ